MSRRASLVLVVATIGCGGVVVVDSGRDNSSSAGFGGQSTTGASLASGPASVASGGAGDSSGTVATGSANSAVTSASSVASVSASAGPTSVAASTNAAVSSSAMSSSAMSSSTSGGLPSGCPAPFMEPGCVTSTSIDDGGMCTFTCNATDGHSWASFCTAHECTCTVDGATYCSCAVTDPAVMLCGGDQSCCGG